MLLISALVANAQIKNTSGTYAGAFLRSAGTSVPTLDTNDLTLFFDGRDFDGLSNGDVVTAITDHSTNAWSWTRTGTFFRTNALGVVGLQFPGDGHWTTASAVAQRFTSSNECTIAVKMLQFSSSSANALIGFGGGTKNLNTYFTYSDVLYFDFGSDPAGRINVAQPTGWDNTWHTVVVRHKTDGTQDIIVDGVSLVSGTKLQIIEHAETGTLSIGAGSGLGIKLYGIVRFAQMWRVWKSDTVGIEAWLNAN